MPLWLRTKKCSHNVNADINFGGKSAVLWSALQIITFVNEPHDSAWMFDVRWRSVKWTSWEGDKHHVCAPFSRFSWHAPFPEAFSSRYYTFLSPTRADTRALAGPHAELPNRGFNLNPFRNQLIHTYTTCTE